MLQQLLLQCYLYCFIELLADSYPMLQDSSEDASLWIGLAYSLLSWYFLSCSPLYSLPFPFDTLHKSLVAGRKTRGYTRYSPSFIFFTVFPDRPLQSTLEPRSRRSPTP